VISPNAGDRGEQLRRYEIDRLAAASVVIAWASASRARATASPDAPTRDAAAPRRATRRPSRRRDGGGVYRVRPSPSSNTEPDSASAFAGVARVEARGAQNPAC